VYTFVKESIGNPPGLNHKKQQARTLTMSDPDAVVGTRDSNSNSNSNNSNTKEDASNNPLFTPCVVTSSTEVARTRWLSLHTLQWTDPTGATRLWDCAARTTKGEDPTAVDAVIIIPILKDPNDPTRPIETLLVEQYRPPVRSVTLEFPAGLVDQGETVVQAALRELREETGYIGEACRSIPMVSSPLCMSPGLCNEIVQVVIVDVDLSNPYNHHIPIPQLDHGEFCTVRRVTLQQGMQQILQTHHHHDDNIDTTTTTTTTTMPIMGLYLFALGWELGRQQQQPPPTAAAAVASPPHPMMTVVPPPPPPLPPPQE
jgi:ADP-ribose pyrophosphatase